MAEPVNFVGMVPVEKPKAGKKVKPPETTMKVVVNFKTDSNRSSSIEFAKATAFRRDGDDSLIELVNEDMEVIGFVNANEIISIHLEEVLKPQ